MHGIYFIHSFWYYIDFILNFTETKCQVLKHRTSHSMSSTCDCGYKFAKWTNPYSQQIYVRGTCLKLCLAHNRKEAIYLKGDENVEICGLFMGRSYILSFRLSDDISFSLRSLKISIWQSLWNNTFLDKIYQLFSKDDLNIS